MSAKVKVPLLDLKAQYNSIKSELDAALLSGVESQMFILGPDVEALEKEIAAYSNAPHAIGCASGSDALLLALMALDIKPGDEVICPSYTFFATGGAISRLGAVPVYADILPATYNVDPQSVKRAAAKCKRLKAIIPVHLYGQCANMAELENVAAGLGVPIIEDAAQAIGSADELGRRAGSMSIMGCFSFFPSKNLGGYGDGGMLTAKTVEIADKLKILRQHGSKPKYYHKVVGVNSRLDTIQASILRVKLKHLDRWTAKRQANAKFYDEAFLNAGAQQSSATGAPGKLKMKTPAPGAKSARHIYNQYVIRVPAELREPLREHLKTKDIGTEVYYPVPLHLQECFKDLGYAKGSLPECEAAANETLALPIYPELTPEQLNQVVSSVLEFVIGK